MDSNFIIDKLNVDLSFLPKKQKSRRLAKQHVKTMKQEVERSKQARAIREVFFPEWMSNTMVVKKKNDKWQVCVDFTDLNQACPKDPFPVRKID